jgi:hypothetical protein
MASQTKLGEAAQVNAILINVLLKLIAVLCKMRS